MVNWKVLKEGKIVDIVRGRKNVYWVIKRFETEYPVNDHCFRRVSNNDMKKQWLEQFINE